MRLSFVVPAYNEETYLPACLESILAQTRELDEAVEIIVVNNASTDRTREVALKFSGVRVVDEPRKGLTYARQAYTADDILFDRRFVDVLRQGAMGRVEVDLRHFHDTVELSG